MKNRGITLIALAVTVIVLLIISGVTISYMTGENGIINQSKESKKFAGTVEEKEVLNTSVTAAVGKSSKSKVEENNLKKYLNQNVGDEVKDYTLEKRDGYYSVTFTATGNEYVVWENGTVQDMDEYQKTPYLKLDPSELNALETESSQVIKAITNVDNPNISWETSNENIVTIQKKSNTEITVTGKNNGSAVITAKMDKLETKCQVTVITSPKEIILSQTEIMIDLSSGSKTVQITPTITPDSANKNITWTSSNTSIARVDEFGTITGISNGEATVTAKTVNGLTKICKVKVVTSPTAISLNKTNAVIDTTTSKNMQLTAVITPASANIYTGITWTSSNDNVVQVNQQGLVKGISNGLATVTAKTENGCTAQCRIVVGATIAGINLAPSNSAIEIEEKLQINATIEPNTSEETLIWVSSNSKVATVDQNGLVTGKSHGTVTITATGRDSMVANSVKVTVQTAPKSISLNITEKTIDLSTDAKSFQLIGTISPSTANVYLEQTWTSDNTSVANVDNNGRVTALKNGDATITVSTGNKKTATCKVKVVTSPTGIALDKNRATVNLSGTKKVDLTATLTPKTANIYDDLQWSSDSASAKVEKTGKYTARVTGVSNGNAKITVSTGNGYKAECIVTVETKIIGITVSPNETEVEVGSTVTLTATKKPSIGSTEGLVWSSSNNGVAKVNDDGVVTGIAQGTVTITIKSSSGLVKTKAKVTVVQSPTGITLDKNKVALDMSGTKTTKLNTTIQPSNANRNTGITWNSSNTGVATVDQSGNVTAKANGTTTITATTQNGKSASCTVTVTTAITSLTVSPTSKTLKTGETVQLTATKNPSTATEGITWTSSNSSVATIDQNGLVIAKGSGTATITVKSSTGGKSATCTITVEAGIAPVDPDNATDVTFSTEYGRIDIIWLDNSNNVISTPNMPILTSNGESMTPIIWNNEYKVVETTSTNSEWYDYSQKKWANAITANGSYFVWIPRYAYRITYYSDSNYENVTGYYDGYGQWCATTKKLRYKIEDGIKTKEYNGMKYIVHPAFCSDVNYGGFGKEISGFWVAKFKVSANEHDALGNMYGLTGDLQSVPGVWIGFKQTPGGFYKIARNATFGYTGEKDPIDGYTSYMNSHMAKNSEWGAIVYLTHSKFGKDGVNNISKGLKLYSGGENSGYSKYGWKRNISISTTGNVYGIYDMNQEVNENVAVFAEEIDKRNIKNYGWTELNKSLESTKYATKYKNPNKAKQGNKTLFNYSITGDAIKEINTGGIDSILSESYHGNWFSMMKFVYNSWPFSYRTGFYGVSNDNGSGAVVQNFRDILVP